MDISAGAVGEFFQETLAELREASHESAESWRRLELDRLDSVLKAWLPVAQEPKDPKAARGAAIVIRAIEAQARLLGLDAAAVVLQVAEKQIDPAQALAESAELREAMENLLRKAQQATRLGRKVRPPL